MQSVSRDFHLKCMCVMLVRSTVIHMEIEVLLSYWMRFRHLRLFQGSAIVFQPDEHNVHNQSQFLCKCLANGTVWVTVGVGHPF